MSPFSLEMGQPPYASQNLIPGVGGMGVQPMSAGFGHMVSPQGQGTTTVTFTGPEMMKFQSILHQQGLLERQQQAEQLQNMVSTTVGEVMANTAAKLVGTETTQGPQVMMGLPTPRPKMVVEEVVEVPTPEVTPTKRQKKQKHLNEKMQAELRKAKEDNKALIERLERLEGERKTVVVVNEEGRDRGTGRSKSRSRGRGDDDGVESEDDALYKARADSPAKNTRQTAARRVSFAVETAKLSRGSPSGSEAESTGRSCVEIVRLARQPRRQQEKRKTVSETQKAVLGLLKLPVAERATKINESMRALILEALQNTKDEKVEFPSSVPDEFDEIAKVAQCVEHVIKEKDSRRRGRADMVRKTALLEGVFVDGPANLPKWKAMESMADYIGRCLYWLILCKVDISGDVTMGLIWEMATNTTVNMQDVIVVE